MASFEGLTDQKSTNDRDIPDRLALRSTARTRIECVKGTLQLRDVLPNIPSRSTMYRDLKKFVEALHSATKPDHRRIDRRRARLLCSNRRDNVVVTMTVLENEFEYATRKLIHATNEIFMIFLRDGPYSEYIQEVFGASH